MVQRRVPDVEGHAHLLRLVREVHRVLGLRSVTGGAAGGGERQGAGNGSELDVPADGARGHRATPVSTDAASTLRVNVRWVTRLGDETASIS